LRAKKPATHSPKLAINAGNLNRKYKVDIGLVKNIARKVLKEIGCAGGLGLEVQFVDDRAIRTLNGRFKDLDRATDVLSFDLGTRSSVVISLDTARRNAGIFGVPIYEEVARYIIHGILHLFGYDDDTRPNRRKMVTEEDRLLGILCENINLSKVLTPR
jgi:probable rRNA maturation factor